MRFDNYEMHPVVALDPQGNIMPRATAAFAQKPLELEQAGDDVAETDIFCWSVYGHLPEGGVECIADCPTAEDAQLITDALTFYLVPQRAADANERQVFVVDESTFRKVGE